MTLSLPASRPRPGLTGWGLVLLLAATQLAAFTDRSLITLVVQPVKGAMSLSDTQVGLLQGSAFVLLNALALPVTGRWVDRGHGRLVVIGSILLWSTATIACGFARSFAELFVCRVLVGVGQAGILPAALSLMAHGLNRDRLGTSTSMLTGGASLGRSFALLGGGAVLAALAVPGNPLHAVFGDGETWRSLFVVSGLVPNVALLAGSLFIVQPGRGEEPARPSLRVAGLWLARRRARYLPLVVSSIAAMLVSQTLTAWAPTFYGRVFGLPPARIGMLLGTIVLCAAPLGHLAGGRLLDRIGRRDRRAALILVGSGLALVTPAAALMSFAGNLAGSLAGFAALVAVLGLTSPPTLAGLQRITPRFLRGQITGVFVSAVTLVSLGTGPVLIGLLNDTVFGTDKVASALMTLFPVAAIAGSLVAFAAARALPGRRMAATV